MADETPSLDVAQKRMGDKNVVSETALNKVAEQLPGRPGAAIFNRLKDEESPVPSESTEEFPGQ